MSNRIEKISGLLRREIALILQREFEHEGLGLIGVTDVEVSRDVGHARVYISVLEAGRARETLVWLNEHSGEIRHILAGNVRLRNTPALKFIQDTSSETGQRIESLLAASRRHKSALPSDPDTDASRSGDDS